MTQYNHRRKRKLKPIPCIITAIAIIVVIGGLYFLLGRKDAYSQYKEYNEDNKKVGEVKNINKDDDKFYQSIYYPSFKDKTLNKIIKETYTAFIKNEKPTKDQQDILYMDYSSKEIYKQYIVLEFDFKRVDSETDKETKQTKLFTYDKNTKKVLTLENCLHGKYKDLLNTMNVKDIDPKSTNISIGKDSFTYYPNSDQSKGVEIKYSDNKDYILLANKNIPSNVPTGIKQPVQQTVDKNKKMIAITMDDGPHKTLTQRAMTAFEQYKGRATFFELGQNVEKYPDIVKDVYERGFEISSHTYSHSQLNKLDAPTLDGEIKKTQDAVFKITGYESKLIRPPYGAKNETVISAFTSYDLTSVLWDVDTLDWKHRDANYVCDQIVNNAFDGAIVLIHDIHETSIAGLELALPKLADQGYQFVSVSTLYQYKDVKK